MWLEGKDFSLLLWTFLVTFMSQRNPFLLEGGHILLGQRSTLGSSVSQDHQLSLSISLQSCQAGPHVESVYTAG